MYGVPNLAGHNINLATEQRLQLVLQSQKGPDTVILRFEAHEEVDVAAGWIEVIAGGGPKQL